MNLFFALAITFTRSYIRLLSRSLAEKFQGFWGKFFFFFLVVTKSIETLAVRQTKNFKINAKLEVLVGRDALCHSARYALLLICVRFRMIIVVQCF